VVVLNNEDRMAWALIGVFIVIFSLLAFIVWVAMQ
jgi:hypothetical protein